MRDWALKVLRIQLYPQRKYSIRTEEAGKASFDFRPIESIGNQRAVRDPFVTTPSTQIESLCSVAVLEHMLWGTSNHSDLSDRISHWQEEVFTSTVRQGSIGKPRSEKHEPYHMTLRPRSRPALAEVSGNCYSKKRKASTMVDVPAKKHGRKEVTNDFVDQVAPRPGPGRPRKIQQYDRDEDEDVEQPKPRRPGRPAKNREPITSREVTKAFPTDFPLAEPSRPGSISPSKGSRSPTKRGQLTVYKPIQEAAIDMYYLSRCSPAVHLTKFHTMKKFQRGIPPLVSELFEKLQSVPSGSIPVALQVPFSPFCI